MRTLLLIVLAMLGLSMPAIAVDDPELLLDINLEPTGLPVQRFSESGGRLFFTAGGFEGEELWTSDGTAAGTVLVKDINPSGTAQPDLLTDVNGTLFFVAYDGVNG